MERVRGASEDLLETVELKSAVESGLTGKIDGGYSWGSRNMAQRPERYSSGRLAAGGGAIESQRRQCNSMERVTSVDRKAGIKM